jgi:hypothetical protein
MDFDSIKNKAGELAGKAKEFADDHEQQVEDGLDKAAGFVEGKVGHGEQIDKAVDKAKGLIGDK